MATRTLGKTSLASFPIGLGCMGMSDFYGPADRQESLNTIHAALERGINLLDTGDFYGMGHNEILIGEAIRAVPREKLILSVKFGAQRDPGGAWQGFDARPAAVKTALAYTLKRLGTDYIDIYRPARLDPSVPIEDTVGAIADMIRAGYVRQLGLSEVGSETIRRAHAVHPVCDLQIEYSLLSRGIEKSILGTCRERGIGITAYGVLCRGLINESWTSEGLSPKDFRRLSPRFQWENAERNRAALAPLKRIAEKHTASISQIAVAWVLARGDDILPLVGSRRRSTLTDSLKALDIQLSATDLEMLNASFPEGTAAGNRYAEPQFSHLDSERG